MRRKVSKNDWNWEKMQLPQSFISSLSSIIFSLSIVVNTIVCVTWNSSYREQSANTLTTTAMASERSKKSWYMLAMTIWQGFSLPFPNLISCSYCNMPLRTDLAVDRDNSKLEVRPFLRKEGNVCLDRVTSQEQYNPLQYGKTAMGMDTLEKNGN